MEIPAYCNDTPYQGLPCAKDNLVLIRKLSEEFSTTWENIVSLYQCKVCQGW